MATKYIWHNVRKVYVNEHLGAQGHDQEWLAKEMNTSAVNVSRWLNDPKRISLHVLSAMADAIGLENIGDLTYPPEQLTPRAILQRLERSLPPDEVG